MFRVNLESVTFMKVMKIMYLDKAYIIAKEECLSFIKKQTEIQIYKFYARYAHEIDVKRWICHRSKRNEIHGGG